MIWAMKYARKTILCLPGAFLLVLAQFFSTASAQLPEISFTSSPNPVGSGARALGMGGAFIAVADDATAASWNPGGLVQLERPELSVVGEGVYRSESNHFAAHPGASREENVSSAGLNYLSAAYPFSLLNHNMIVSLNYQHLYDFSRKADFAFKSPGRYKDIVDYSADGGLYAWGIAYALQIVPRLSFGFTLNLWQDGIYPDSWETTLNQKQVLRSKSGMVLSSTKISAQDRYSFSGFNANVGFLWNATDKLTLGTVLKTPFTANLRHESLFQTVQTSPFFRSPIVNQSSKTTDETLAMPLSYGFGMAFRCSDRLTFSTDVSHTSWQNYILTTADGKKLSPITKGPADQAEITSTTQVRIGSEYLFIQPNYTVPVRLGFFYDPAPAQGATDNFFGLSIGSGIGIGRFIFDVAYVYRFARNVGESNLTILGFSQDVNEHSFYTSLIIHF